MSKLNQKYVYYRPAHGDAEAQLPTRPAQVVEKGAGLYPRSYFEHSALIAAQLHGQTARQQLIRVPVDYNGQHEAPQNATQLNEFQAAVIDATMCRNDRRSRVLAGGARQGAELPADYDPAHAYHVVPTHACCDVNDNARLYRVPMTQLDKIRNVLEDPAAHKGENVYQSLLGADGKTLPELVLMRNGAYLVFEDTPDDVELNLDRNSDLGEYEEAVAYEKQLQQTFGDDYQSGLPEAVEYVTRASLAEFAWLANDNDDIKSGITPPPPPKALEDLFTTDHFRAAGASFDALKEISKHQKNRREAEDALEVALFGPPSVKDTFNVQGRSFATYDTSLHPVFDDAGHAVGIRCDWTPLHPNYTGMKNVDPPEGWVELEDNPGVFAPDPATNPQDAEMLSNLDWPDYRDYPDAFGGGDEPVIRIEHNDKATYPRAYKTYSRVHALQDENGPLYYIDAPTDYKGNVFQPTGAARLTKFEYAMLTSGMGDMYEPAFIVRDEGIATPADYSYADPAGQKQETRYFKLAGRSKQIFDAFEQEREDIAEQRRKFVESIGGSGSYSYQGAEIISVEFEEDVPPQWVVERESKGTNIDDDGNLVYVARYTCVPDTSTPQGRELARRMKEDFDREPDFRDLQQRWTPNAPHMPHPQWRRDEDEPVFFYNTDSIKGGKLVPPPDAVELKPHVTQWLARDKTDRACGIKPPPMPPEIGKELQQHKKSAPKQHGPKV